MIYQITSHQNARGLRVFAGLRLSWGAMCEVELNHLMPWIDKNWALHPYLPELISKKRT